jgi:hypothetical protein
MNIFKKLLGDRMKKIANKKLKVEFELIDTLTQGMLEKFEARLLKDKAEGAGVKTTYGKFLRAAIAVGWVQSPRYNDDQIAALDPRIVALVGAHLVQEYNDASTVPNA